MNQDIKKTLIIILVLFITFLSFLNAFAKGSSPFHWDFINVDIELQKNGDMLITETQKYVFEKEDYSNQRYRYIPLSKIDKISDVEVYEGNRKLYAETKLKNKQFWIKWKHGRNTQKTHIFILKYRAIGALHVYEYMDHIYWKAIFPKRSAVIKNAKITVYLPDKFKENKLTYISYGISTKAKLINKRTVEFVSLKPLPPNQGIVVRVSFSHKILHLNAPAWQNNFQNKREDSMGWLVISLGLVLLIIFLLLDKIDRNAKGGYSCGYLGVYSGGYFGGGSGGGGGGGG